MKMGSTKVTEGNILRQLIFFSLPLILGNLTQQIYTTLDLMIVGRYADSIAVAAVGSPNSLISLLTGLLNGLGTATGVIISQYYGAGEKDGIRKAVGTSIIWSSSSGIVISVIAIMAAPWLLTLMSTPPEVMPEAVIYFRLYFVGMVFNLTYQMCANILRAVGDSKHMFYYLITGCCVKIAFSYIFTGLLSMRAAGSALATVLGDFVSMGMALLNLTRTQDIYRLEIRHIAFDKGIFKKMFTLGMPSGLQSEAVTLSNVVIQAQINTFGAAAMAGYSTGWRLNGFLFMFIGAGANAITSFVGQNIGAGKPERARRATWLWMIFICAVSLVMGILLFVFGREILGLFKSEKEVIDNGMKMLVFTALTYWFYAIGDICAGAVRGAGATGIPMTIALIGTCGVRLTWIFLMRPIWNDVQVVFASYTVSWIVTTLSYFFYFYKGKWADKRITK